MAFADAIVRLRQEAGMSQQEVADYMSIARATYAGLEVGRRDPNLSEINALAQLYQVSQQSLIDGVADAEPTAGQITAATDEPAVAPDVLPREIVQESPERLRQVLLYVLDKVGAKPNVGETVLYKLLYFIDFDYYEKYGKSITGLTYVRNHFGPTPRKASTFDEVVKRMMADDELDIVTTKFFRHDQKKYLPTVKPTLDVLSAQELQHIDQELARLGDKTATELSELSHKDIPWLSSKDRQPINYQLAKYRTTATSVSEPEDEL